MWMLGRHRSTGRSPRARGRHRGVQVLDPWYGRSPRARGRRLVRGAREGLRGPIPASAGETRTPTCRRSATGADPRERGGDVVYRPRVDPTTGRSPRARGRPLPGTANPEIQGPIPASAGETRSRIAPATSPRADPRERGGDASRSRSPRRTTGRSPRARGRLREQGERLSAVRPIPASAGETRRRRPRTRSSGADPRERGGDDHLDVAVRNDLGRSPRARGRLNDRPLLLAQLGPIPASAGETAAPWPCRGPPAADPRERGGDTSSASAIASACGRSPRARGRRERQERRLHLPGPIPASAGETPGRRPTRRPWGADPRERGGDAAAPASARSARGRSPRARGRPLHRHAQGRELGPIPASAGETRASASSAPGPRADPRERGGDMALTMEQYLGQGRSPRARGRHPRGPGPAVRPGPIPASAGETRPGGGYGRTGRADPRERGGDTSGASRCSITSGRSPRARGRHVALAVAVRLDGPIPASAGETPRAGRCRSTRTADPRERGGDPLKATPLEARKGRSPRARGRREREQTVLGAMRPIPASAGETLMPHLPRCSARADPRERGGDGIQFFRAGAMWGRSPRARGRPWDGPFWEELEGPIPASAGETRGGGDRDGHPAADPRERGGDAAARPAAEGAAGRSPRARGRRARPGRARAPVRPIPASAGETSR